MQSFYCFSLRSFYFYIATHFIYLQAEDKFRNKNRTLLKLIRKVLYGDFGLFSFVGLLILVILKTAETYAAT